MNYLLHLLHFSSSRLLNLVVVLYCTDDDTSIVMKFVMMKYVMMKFVMMKFVMMK